MFSSIGSFKFAQKLGADVGILMAPLVNGSLDGTDWDLAGETQLEVHGASGAGF